MSHRSFFRWAALLAVVLGANAAHAQQFLKQSTASQAIKLCGFVDSTDGNTEESGLTIANTDIKISKAGGAFASKNSGGGTYDAVGCYTATLDATDTNTVGRLDIAVHPSGALPVYARYQVVEEAIFDGLYGASAGTSTTILPVNTIQLNGTSQTGRDIGASVLLSSGTGTGQVSLTSGVVNANTTQISGSAVSTSSAQIGVNVVNAGGTAWGSGAITAGSIASSAITNAKFAAGAIDAAAIADGAIDNATFACSGGSLAVLGITDCGTAQAYTSGTPSLTLRSAAAFGDNALTGATAVICGSTQGYCQAATIASNVGSTDVATLSAALPVTASGTITYYIFGTATATGGSGLDAAGVRAAIGLSTANLDTQLGAIDDYIDTEVAAIKTKTDFLPSATAGSAGGLFIAGTNAATSITSGLTANITGNVSGSVGSVTGNVGGNVTGSVGSVASGGITASSIAADAIGASELAADAVTEIQSGLATSTALSTLTTTVGTAGAGLTAVPWNSAWASNFRSAVGLASANLDTQLSTIDTVVDSILDDTGTSGVVVASGSKTGYTLSAAGVDAVWDEAQSGHATAGTFGAYLDSAVSGVSTGGISAGEIADAVWDEALSGHATAGSAGEAQSAANSINAKIGTPSNLGGGASLAANLADIESQTDDIGVAGAGLTAADDAIMARLGTPAGASIAADIAAVNSFVDTEVAAVKAVTDKIDTALELDGSVYRFTTNALENAPAGGGGGGSDWTTGEKEQIRYRLGIDGTATVPSAVPSLATATSLRDLIIEDQGGGVSLGCAISVALAYAAGDLSTSSSTSTYKDPSGAETRITGTVSSTGNRAASITCPSY